MAYQLDAHSHNIELGANWALSRSAALDFSALYYDTSGRGGNDYDGLVLRASLLYRF